MEREHNRLPRIKGCLPLLHGSKTACRQVGSLR